MANVDILRGQRVLVVGLGQEGQALAVYLREHQLDVTATDQQTAAALGAQADTLAEAGVKLALGGHPPALLDEADLVMVSAGVPRDIPFLAEAQARNLPLCTESRLFCYLCPAPIIGITGSSGKTTTTTLTGQIMQATGRQTWVGGNIGRPLISVVDQIKPEDIVVMELSSFQLEYFHAALNETAHVEPALQPVLDSWSPPISAILNITPNHLDRHPSMRQYVRAKRAIIDYQGPADVAVLGLDNDLTRTIGWQLRPRVRWFSLSERVANGATLSNDAIILLDEADRPETIINRADIQLRGEHNLRNIMAACLLSRAAGASPEPMRQAIAGFKGVEHRLEPVREVDGVRYFNDSIATTPARVVAALRSFREPLILLAGGRDKRLPWDEAARLILRTGGHVILFGEAAGLIEAAIERNRADIKNSPTAVSHAADLPAAVNEAAGLAAPGTIVLLSPGCASYDMFSSYVERGRRFKEVVNAL